MHFGLTIKKEAVNNPLESEEKFSPQRPAFKPSNLDCLNPPDKDHTPAPSILQQAIDEGNDRVAQLLIQAQQAAKEQAKIIEQNKKPRAPKKTDKNSNPPEIQAKAKLIEAADPALIVDDETFIKQTRDANIWDPKVRASFIANGGQYYLDAGLSYASAFDQLRQAKQTKLLSKGKIAQPYQRVFHPNENDKIYVPGMPTRKQLEARARAKADARKRRANDAWLQSKKF